MKPIFCTDITLNKNNEEINGKEFITATAPEGMRTVLEDKAAKLEKSIESARLPSWLVMVRSIVGFGALLFAITAFRIVTESGIPYLFAGENLLITLLCVGCAVGWFMLNKYEKTREKSIVEAENIEGQSRALENELATIYLAMGVPQGADDADIIMFQYKIKDGAVVPSAHALIPTPYINFENKIFDDGDNLCFADTENVYSFKKSDLRAIRTVEKKISVPSWNKKSMPTEGEYATYGMTVNKMGMVTMKRYHILEIEHEGELLGIYFPCYELDTFERLTGLREDDETVEESLDTEKAHENLIAERTDEDTASDTACEMKTEGSFEDSDASESENAPDGDTE